MRFLVTDTNTLERFGAHSAVADDGSVCDVLISWNTFGDEASSGSPRVVHLGELLHDQEEQLQRTLLAWLGRLATRHTASDSPLPLVYPNLHAWWLLTITEKNYATTPQLTTLAKLVLLHDLCTREAVTHLEYRGENRALEAVLRDFAEANGWRSNARRAPLLRRLRRQTESLQAVAHFARAFMQSITAAIVSPRRTRSVVNPDVAFVGYLIPAGGTTRGQSPYWGALEDHLSTSTRALWLFHRSDEMPLRAARRHCAEADQSRSRCQHRVIEDFLTPGVVLKAIGTYLAWRPARRLALDVSNSVEGRTIPVAELFADHLGDSLSGSRAVSTILHCHAYEHLAARFRDVTWLYLWENKPFEHALNSAVGRHSSGTTVGYAHSVVRRRDHRYFDETAATPLETHRGRPAATVYAVNGELPLRNLRDLGMPTSPVVEVEALRYSPLSAAQRDVATRMLVVGDINAHESRRLLDLARAALSSDDSRLAPWFKPHPGSPHHAEMAAAVGFTVSNDPLASLAPDVALAVVGSAGAASIDLTMLGVPVATVLDPESMNLSPLLGIYGACFVRSATELRSFIAAPRLHDVRIESIMHRADPPQRWLNLLDRLSS